MRSERVRRGRKGQIRLRIRSEKFCDINESENKQGRSEKLN